MNTISDTLKSFLQYITVQIINHPQKAELRMVELEKNHLNFRIIVDKEDVPLLIGKNGYTISSIRSLCKGIAEANEFSVRVQIFSHEELENASAVEKID